MNLANLTSLLVVVICLAGGAIASASAGTPWWVAALCGVVGLASGCLIAWPVSKLAHQLLGLDSAVGFVAYLIFPWVALIRAGGVSDTVRLTSRMVRVDAVPRCLMGSFLVLAGNDDCHLVSVVGLWRWTRRGPHH